jgi:hypothetical protein
MWYTNPKMRIDVKKYVACGAVILSFLFVSGGALFVRAADQSTQPQFLFSWRAVGGAPAWYSGKVLPTYQSSIILSVTMLQGNKIVSLDGRAVKWFINGDLVAHGIGLGSILFVNKRVFGGGELDIKVSTQTTDPTMGDNAIQSGYFTIPVVSPQVVIQAPPFVDSFSPGQIINLAAIPFFFTVSPEALSIKWTVNGSTAQSSSDSSHLSIHLDQHAAAGSQSVQAVVSNPAQSGIEQGSASYFFSIR